MPASVEVVRYTAFATDPSLGNPAGVVMDAAGLSSKEMLAVAAEVGYSETAFVTGPIDDNGSFPLRYFSPLEEVTFCGHATIATAAALAEHVGIGTYTAQIAAGPVIIEAARTSDGPRGSFDSPPTGTLDLPQDRLAILLDCLGWDSAALDASWRPGVGVCGNQHPVLVARSVGQLAHFSYDFNRLQAVSREFNWQTIQIVARTGEGTWRSRNPFPLGGVVEDPATGSAAAAFVGYLRAQGELGEGDRLIIDQGVEMGRHSRIEVDVLADRARISGVCSALA
ncbi:PhzF family phenazine biosynthesis protein [Austwickia chelonae]|uniref:PhzF family phenazine biosynthesis protein n=1 Tax=Austwickia chelonae TaxID=100225 RepID=UPI000E26ABC6|nr:PhzF family phenazine biosynthesis protein [Austwickia chelonae]